MRQKIEHGLDQATARKVARVAASSYVDRFQRYDANVTWSGDDSAELSFSAKGVKISGSLQLVPGAIEVDLSVPMLLRPFAGKAKQVIDRELRTWTDKAERGELEL